MATDYTPESWSREVLRRLGIPATSENIQAMIAWTAAEGGHFHNTAHYNLLNTTLDEPGATSMNSVGVKSYVSWEQGLNATVRTLHSKAYANVLTQLRTGDATSIAHAVGNSPWGTSFAAIQSADVSSATKGQSSNITSDKPSGITGAIDGVGSAVSDVVSAPVKFFNLITNVSFWLRFGEAIAALVLIAMGLRTLTGSPAIPSLPTLSKGA